MCCLLIEYSWHIRSRISCNDLVMLQEATGAGRDSEVDEDEVLLNERSRILQLKLRELQMKKQHMESLVCTLSFVLIINIECRMETFILFFVCRCKNFKSCKWLHISSPVIIRILVLAKTVATKNCHENVVIFKIISMMYMITMRDLEFTERALTIFCIISFQVINPAATTRMKILSN